MHRRPAHRQAQQNGQSAPPVAEKQLQKTLSKKTLKIWLIISLMEIKSFLWYITMSSLMRSHYYP